MTIGSAQAVCTGAVFNDVNINTVGEFFCDFIERFRALEITGGCVADDPLTLENEAQYCPGDNVTRSQIAVFVTRAIEKVPAGPQGPGGPQGPVGPAGPPGPSGAPELYLARATAWVPWGQTLGEATPVCPSGFYGIYGRADCISGPCEAVSYKYAEAHVWHPSPTSVQPNDRCGCRWVVGPHLSAGVTLECLCWCLKATPLTTNY